MTTIRIVLSIVEANNLHLVQLDVLDVKMTFLHVSWRKTFTCDNYKDS
jgi:hypothetical protein